MSAPDVRATVLEVIREILPDLRGQDIPLDRHLKQLGADSVDRVEIIITLLDRLRIAESMSVYADIPDVGHLIAHLEDRSGP